jgi:(p)ppGpp synthase/HD superfamily hydrolase
MLALMKQAPDPVLTSSLGEGLGMAVEYHANQAKKGSSIPYVSHLLGVCALVLEYGGTEVQAIAALLHDAAEDAGGEPVLAAIAERFGEPIAAIVRDCSDTTVEPKPEWAQRKRKYIEHLVTVPTDVLLVSACDKLHNLRAIAGDRRVIGDKVFDRFRASADATRGNYAQLIAVYKARGGLPAPLILELDRALAEIGAIGSRTELPA